MTRRITPSLSVTSLLCLQLFAPEPTHDEPGRMSPVCRHKNFVRLGTSFSDTSGYMTYYDASAIIPILLNPNAVVIFVRRIIPPDVTLLGNLFRAPNK